MRVRRTMAVADKVARRVGALLRGFKRDHYSQELYLYPFFNCRERGYALWVDVGFPTFLFAENRNSDDIVVYEDPDWNHVSGPSEKCWENRKFFSWQHEEEAAQYIVKRLKKLLPKYDREQKKKQAQRAKEEKVMS